MTEGKDKPEASDFSGADWKLVVRTLKTAGTTEARVLVERAVLEAGGMPIRLREARRRLFILTTSASGGRPAIIEGEGGLVVLVALDDLVDVVVERGPTLAEVMKKFRRYRIALSMKVAPALKPTLKGGMPRVRRRPHLLEERRAKRLRPEEPVPEGFGTYPCASTLDKLRSLRSFGSQW